MGSSAACPIIKALVSTILQLCAVATMIAAVGTPNWLLMYDPPSHQYHRHGLWQVCTQLADQQPDGTVILTGDEKCTFMKWPESTGRPLSQDDQMHSLSAGKMAVMALLCTAVVLGIINLFVACCGACQRHVSAAWTLSALIATGLAMGGVGMFAINANDATVRYIVVTTEVDTQYYGDSFWLALAACPIFGIATIFSGVMTVLGYIYPAQDRKLRDRNPYRMPTRV